MAHLWFLAKFQAHKYWVADIGPYFSAFAYSPKAEAESRSTFNLSYWSRETRGKKKIKKWQPKLWFHHLLHLQWRLRDKFLEQDQLNPQLGHQEKVPLLLGQLLLLLLRSVCFSLQKPFFFFPFFPLLTAASTLSVAWVLTYLRKKELKCIFL